MTRHGQAFKAAHKYPQQIVFIGNVCAHIHACAWSCRMEAYTHYEDTEEARATWMACLMESLSDDQGEWNAGHGRLRAVPIIEGKELDLYK